MKKIICILLTAALSICILGGCAEKENKVTVGDPDIQQIRNICKLATLECYYHNVAKSDKAAGSGLSHIWEKDRKFWIEYTGIARLGVDMSKVDMKIRGNSVQITMPPAEIISIKIDEDSLNENSYIASSDGINKNKITAEDQTIAINEAQKEMEKEVAKNSEMLLRAQDRAKKLIENYINQLGSAAGKDYTISWR